MTNTSQSLKVPPGHYRVTGIDTFSWPNEAFFIGVYDSLEAAKAAGQQHRQDMTVIEISDHTGQLVAIARGRGEEW